MKSATSFIAPSLQAILSALLLTASLSGCAMSPSPDEISVNASSLENAPTGKYGKQFEGQDPEVDAREAIEKDNLSLLGFASRVTSVPGVPKDIRSGAIKACGVHLIEGFGDVIRSEAELSAMQKASAYARKYNTVVIKACLKKPELWHDE